MKLKSPDKLVFDIWKSNIGLSLNILRTGSDVAKLSIDPSHRLTLENRAGCNVISVYLLVNLRMTDVPGWYGIMNF